MRNITGVCLVLISAQICFGSSQDIQNVFGPEFTATWNLPKPSDTISYHLSRDATLGRDVLVMDGSDTLSIESREAFAGNIELICLARMAMTSDQPNGRLSFVIARDPCDPEKSPGFSLSLSAKHDGSIEIIPPKLANSRYMHSDPEKVGGSSSGVEDTITYKPRAYDVIPPTWPDRVRIPLESDMKALPAVQDMWIRTRFQLGKGWIRVWIDDRLIVDHEAPDLKTSGIILVRLGPGAQLAQLTVRPLTQQYSLYEPIRLDSYARDRNLTGRDGHEIGVRRDSLNFGATVEIDDIPFSFVDPDVTGGPDHIDVGRSLVRQGSLEGHSPMEARGPRWHGSFFVDPARIQLRIPNGRYRSLHIIAGYDDEPDSVPLISAQFYRPQAGNSMSFEAVVPSVHSTRTDVKPLPVTLDNGKKVNLWLVTIELDPGMLSAFADMGYLELELTKKIHQFRSFPDPIHYGWHGGGLPSGVHVYALTLQRPAVHMEVTPRVFGDVWQYPESPIYDIRLTNRTSDPRNVKVAIETRSLDGGETHTLDGTETLAANQTSVLPFTLGSIEKNGYHDVTVTLSCDDMTWVEKRSFVRLANDTRSAQWQEDSGPLFGYWSYLGLHYTPPKDKIMHLMRMAGARAPHHPGNAGVFDIDRTWPLEEPIDLKKRRAFQDKVVDAYLSRKKKTTMMTFFAEPHISRELTAGNLPSYWGEPEYQLNDQEKKAVRVFFENAKAAAEALRKALPGVPILIPWGDPLFVVPLLRAGYPKELIDGVGIDIAGFERLPEQQLHHGAIHRLYEMTEEFRKFGLADPLFWYMEGIFVPTEPGGCTWREQSNIYDRWALISMAYGIDRFYSGWFAFDCGDWYGTQHYGGCGIQRRIPYCNPKPAYASYATMTRMLEYTHFEKWLPTGSQSTYCLKFSRPKEKGGAVHVLWTLRGQRPVTVTLAQDTTLTLTDSMDNATEHLANGKTVTFLTSPSVVYMTGIEEISSISLGMPDHSESVTWARTRNRDTWQDGPLKRGAEITHEQTIAHLGDGTWQIDEKPDEFDEVYEDNNFGIARYRGKMAVSVVKDAGRKAAALAVKLLKQKAERKLMPWYAVIRPEKPIEIPGKATALGLWVKGASDWGRVVYCLQDAQGERWMSAGVQNQWNCDDPHSWSSFNFDGWRYVRFELPSNTSWDSYREHGTSWWGYAGGSDEGVGIVDLPLRIEKIIVERRTHILYVNDIQPTYAQQNDVLLGDLVAEYADRFNATEKAVALNRKRMPLAKQRIELPNPIADMAANNALPATKLHRVEAPDWGYDGTRCNVYFDEMPGAKQYEIWIAEHSDGRGAVVMGRLSKPSGLVHGLEPAKKLYMWVTYAERLSDQDRRQGKKPGQSRPSNVLEIELTDAFGQK